MDARGQPTNLSKLTDEVHRAFREFLKIPTTVIAAFVVLGIAMVWLEQAGISWINGLQTALGTILFGDASSTRQILTVTATGLITLTSITFTVLLVAVQQAASAMSPQVIDQFLRRQLNQVVFGYFTGASLFATIVLASVRSNFNPILSTALALVFAGFALYVLMGLVYVTLTQMRPSLVLNAIHDGTLGARQRQLRLIRRTTRTPRLSEGIRVPVRSLGDGYLVAIDLEPIERLLDGTPSDIEIVLRSQIGHYIALHDEVAEIRSVADIRTEDVRQAVQKSLKLGRVRDLDYDPAHGIDQIHNIGWTTISTAKHSPAAGSQAVDVLRDLVAEWADEEEEDCPREEQLPVVYTDEVPVMPLRALESLAVAAVESHQHQNYAQVLRTFAVMLARLKPDLQSVTVDAALRLLSRLQKEVPTIELEEALVTLAEALAAAGFPEAAQVTRDARQQARSSVSGLGNGAG